MVLDFKYVISIYPAAFVCYDTLFLSSNVKTKLQRWIQPRKLWKKLRVNLKKARVNQFKKIPSEAGLFVSAQCFLLESQLGFATALAYCLQAGPRNFKKADPKLVGIRSGIFKVAPYSC